MMEIRVQEAEIAGSQVISQVMHTWNLWSRMVEGKEVCRERVCLESLSECQSEQLLKKGNYELKKTTEDPRDLGDI